MRKKYIFYFNILFETLWQVKSISTLEYSTYFNVTGILFKKGSMISNKPKVVK